MVKQDSQNNALNPLKEFSYINSDSSLKIYEFCEPRTLKNIDMTLGTLIKKTPDICTCG